MSSLSVIDARAAARSRTPVTKTSPSEPHPERADHYTQTKLEGRAPSSPKPSAPASSPPSILRPGEVFGPDKPSSPAPWANRPAAAVVVPAGRQVDHPAHLGRRPRRRHPRGRRQRPVRRRRIQPRRSRRSHPGRTRPALPRSAGCKPRLIHFPLFALYPAALGLQIALGLLGQAVADHPYRLSSALGSRRFDARPAREPTRLAAPPRHPRGPGRHPRSRHIHPSPTPQPQHTPPSKNRPRSEKGDCSFCGAARDRGRPGKRCLSPFFIVKNKLAPFVRSTRRAVPAKGACPLFIVKTNSSFCAQHRARPQVGLAVPQRCLSPFSVLTPDS